MPEPQHAVTINGVTFEVGDIKALMQNVFDPTSAVMLGGRCNSQGDHARRHGSANDECADVNPGALHVMMTNFLGLDQLPLVEDRTANYEVWNQPVVGYEITQQTKVAASAANRCVGAPAHVEVQHEGEELYEVRMTVSTSPRAARATSLGFHDNVSTDNYHYILELDAPAR